jgi:uncharacterized hydrophobic protein (TIGR00341 family)
MALRLIEVVLPEREAETLPSVVDMAPQAGPWHERLEDGRLCVRLLFDRDDTGAVVDELERRFGNVSGFHLLILPVQAALPRPPEPEAEKDRGPTFGAKGLSREELSGEARDMAKPTRVFFATVVLSTVVVAIGLMRDNTAAIIGAMVIAPLLGPNVALALATTLGDTDLLKRGLRSNLIGFVIALTITIALGALVPMSALTREIEVRTTVHWSDLVLALAAGSAGVLALTSGVPTALVGVMVAVALLPPTAVVGLMLGHGRADLALHAGLLLAVNLLGVNLAATATFLAQGIRPRTWWQADRARRSSLVAIGTEIVLVVLLLVLIVISQKV